MNVKTAPGIIMMVTFKISFEMTVGGATAGNSCVFAAKDAKAAEDTFWNDVSRLNLIGIVRNVSIEEVR